MSGSVRSPSRAPEMHDGAERRERDAHVGGVRRDARRRGAEDRVGAVEAARSRRSPGRGRACCSAIPARRRSRCSACAGADCRRRSPCCGSAARRRRRSRGPASGNASSPPGSPPPPCCGRQRRSGAPPSSVSSISLERPVTSTSASGRSIVSRIRSTRFVPPPRYLRAGGGAPAHRIFGVGGAGIAHRDHPAASQCIGLGDRGDDPVMRAATAQVAAHPLT